jgi:hypothetical protein
MVHIVRDQLYTKFIKDITYKKFKKIDEIQEVAKMIKTFAIDTTKSKNFL